MIFQRIFFTLLFFVFYCSVEAVEKTEILLSPNPDASIEKKYWIPAWQSLTAMTIARAGAASVSHADRIYMIGGVDGVNFLKSIESAKINEDGSLSDWIVISQLPEPRGFMSATIHANRIYVVGGGNGAYGKNLLSSIVSAPIFKNGSLGEWRTESERMLTPRRCSKLIVKDNTLHVFGGFGGALLDTVESSQFTINGNLTPWTMQTNKMTMPRYVNEVKRVDDYALVIGGHHPAKGIGVKDVEYTNLEETVMKWQVASSMTTGRYAFGSATHKSRVYAFGGISGAEYLNSSEKLSVTGKIKSNKWSNSTNLPAFMANFTTLVVGEHIYLIGGSTRYKYMPNVWSGTFNQSGDVGYYGSQQELEIFNSLKQTKKVITKLPNSGTVLESIATEGYTYLRVLLNEKASEKLSDNSSKKETKEIWLAAPKMNVALNATIRFSEGVYMSNFRSKSLDRYFSAILFVGTVSVE